MPPERARPRQPKSPGTAGAPAGPSARSQRGLDWLNFFVADVQTAFGPFVAVQLSLNGWSQGAIGSVLTTNGVVGILAQTPAGMLIDHSRAKRAVVAVCLAMTALGALILAFFPHYPPVASCRTRPQVAEG